MGFNVPLSIIMTMHDCLKMMCIFLPPNCTLIGRWEVLIISIGKGYLFSDKAIERRRARSLGSSVCATFQETNVDSHGSGDGDVMSVSKKETLRNKEESG